MLLFLWRMQGNSNSGPGLEPLYPLNSLVIGGWESRSPEKAVLSHHIGHFSDTFHIRTLFYAIICHLFKSLQIAQAIRSFGNAWPFAGRKFFWFFQRKAVFEVGDDLMLVSWGFLRWPMCCQTWWNTVFTVFAWVLRVCCWLSRAAWSLWLVLWTLEHLTRPETNGVRRVLWFDVEYQCCQYCTYCKHCKHIIYMIRKIYRRNDLLFRFIQTDGIVTPFYPKALRILNPTGSKHRRVFQHCWNLIEHWTTCDFLPHKCHAMTPMLFHFSDKKAESIGHFIPDASRRRVFVPFFRAV